MPSSILIIGAAGQLGGALADTFRSHGWNVIAPRRSELDIVEVSNVHDFFAGLQIDVVVNCAWLSVAECETDPRRAFEVNALAAYAVAASAQAAGAISLYVSTDYVFDGERRDGYTESDLAHPINIYGASKLSGEHMTSIASSMNYIVRTSALFGGHAAPMGNFVLKMQARAREGMKTTVVSDQFTRPTYAADLANQILLMIERKAPFGVYHVTGAGEASWFEFAMEIFRSEGRLDLLSSGKTARTREAMLRPRWSLLQNRALSDLGFAELPPWNDALKRYLGTLV